MVAVQPILIVEDETLILMTLVEAFEAGGYTVSECSKGNAAIVFIDESSELHGLVTDIRLGEGPSGWEVAHHARQKYPEIAVVYMSGDSAADWRANGVPNSVMLQKPFPEAQLLTAMSTLLIAAGS